MREPAKVVGVEQGIGKPTPNGTRVYTVWYTFDGSMWKGSVAAKDELDAWRKFQARLDKENKELSVKEQSNEYGKS